MAPSSPASSRKSSTRPRNRIMPGIVPRFTSLPQRALDRIITFTAHTYQSDQVSAGRENETMNPESADNKPVCRHSFARSALNLARTCKLMYSLYNMKILHMLCSDFGALLTPDCQSNFCLAPFFKRMVSIRIWRRELLSTSFECQFTMRKMASAFLIQDLPSCISVIRNRESQETFFRITFELKHSQLIQLFQMACNFKGLKHLEVINCTEILNPEISRRIADAWNETLHTFIVDDYFMTAIQDSMESIGRLKGLKLLRLTSQSIGSLEALTNLSILRSLQLCFCSIHDAHFQPLICHLPSLQHLDVSDTYISPNITNHLPNILVSLSIGEKDRHSRPPYPEDSFYARIMKEYANCSCYAYLGNFHHLPTCETYVPTEINPRWGTRDFPFLRPDKFPELISLEWGHWGQYAQGIASLSGVLPTLRKLTLTGKDYDDTITNYLTSMVPLRQLGLLGCNVTDTTAFVIAKLPYLEVLDISNCVQITSVGLYALADGVAARSGQLKGIRTNTDEKLNPPSTIRRDLIETTMNRTNIFGTYRLE